MSNDPPQQHEESRPFNRYYDAPEQPRTNNPNYSRGTQQFQENMNYISSQTAPFQGSSSSYGYHPHTTQNHTPYLQNNSGYCVLANTGNTCFLNSIIYCLTNISELVKYYRDRRHRFSLSAKNSVSKALADLLDSMQIYSTVRPNELKSALCQYAPVFQGYGQQDAHECLTVLLDALHQESAKKSEDDEERSIITDLCQGQMEYTIKCSHASQCGNVTNTTDPFLDIPVFVDNISVSSSPMFNARFFSMDGKEQIYTFNLTSNATIQSISDRLRQLCVKQGATSIFAMKISSDNTFSGQYRSEAPLSQINDQSTVFYEIDKNDRNPMTVCLFLDKNRSSLNQLYSRPPLLCNLPEWNYTYKLTNDLRNHLNTHDMSYDIEEDPLIDVTPTFLSSHPKTIVVKFDEKAVPKSKPTQLTTHSQGNASVTLEQCLKKNILSVERMSSNSDTWFCSKCDQYRQATKENRILSLPRTLIIHLKRFNMESKQSRSKIETFVKYPFTLNMTEFLSVKSNKEPIYDLISVCLHTGSFESGHYIAYVKKTSGWFRFGDYSASPISDDEVISKNAYILFYLRRTQ